MLAKLKSFTNGPVVLCLALSVVSGAAVVLDSVGVVSFVLGPGWHGDYLAIVGLLLAGIALIVSCALLGDAFTRTASN